MSSADTQALATELHELMRREPVVYTPLEAEMQKLRQSEAMMAAAEAVAHIGSWEVDLTGGLTDASPLRWSDECYRVFGYAPRSVPVTNEFFFSCVHPGDHAAIRETVARALRDSGEYAIVHRIILPGGELRHIQERARVVVDARTGRQLKMAGSAHDVTERQQVLEELRRAKDAAEAADRAKSQFLAMMSHEIRTPLNPILGSVQLLLEKDCSAEQREFLQLINNSGEHLLLLINDVLSLAGMESGEFDLASEQFEPAALLLGVFEIKRAEASRKGLLLEQVLDPRLAETYVGDPERLRQVLLNLTGNAIKFTPRGRVTMRLECGPGDATRDELRFTVEDTGVGIAPEHAARIFEPFYQVDSSSSRRYEGAGVGLAICRRLVKAMHGELGVVSEPGAGSRFWFNVTLPRASNVGEPPPADSRARHPAKPSNL